MIVCAMIVCHDQRASERELHNKECLADQRASERELHNKECLACVHKNFQCFVRRNNKIPFLQSGLFESIDFLRKDMIAKKHWKAEEISVLVDNFQSQWSECCQRVQAQHLRLTTLFAKEWEPVSVKKNDDAQHTEPATLSDALENLDCCVYRYYSFDAEQQTPLTEVKKKLTQLRDENPDKWQNLFAEITRLKELATLTEVHEELTKLSAETSDKWQNLFVEITRFEVVAKERCALVHEYVIAFYDALNMEKPHSAFSRIKQYCKDILSSWDKGVS